MAVAKPPNNKMDVILTAWCFEWVAGTIKGFRNQGTKRNTTQHVLRLLFLSILSFKQVILKNIQYPL